MACLIILSFIFRVTGEKKLQYFYNGFVYIKVYLV
jgi:hypothetical protein